MNNQILSWDIGIKNLSYCHMEKEKIINWGVINLEDPIPLCEGFFKNGNKCNRKASYIEKKPSKENEKEGTFCKTHSIDNCKLIKKKTYSLLEISKRLVDELDKNFKDIELDAVLLENQPALKNPKMKSIQMIIFSYFLINGYSEKIKNIKMVPANRKNKYCNEYCKDNKNIVLPSSKSAYQNAKKTAILVCGDIIKKDFKDNIEIFESSKKKDDLSDSFLQGLQYFN